MGTPISPPNPLVIAGNLCAECWGAGKIWFPFDTPKYVRFKCTGILRGTYKPAQEWPAPPNDIEFILEQTGGTPCEWTYEDAAWLIEWDTESWMYLLSKDHPVGEIPACYFWQEGPVCQTENVNSIVLADNEPMYGGSTEIY